MEEKGARADRPCATGVTANIAVPAVKGNLTGCCPGPTLSPHHPCPASPSVSRGCALDCQPLGAGWVCRQRVTAEGRCKDRAMGEPWQGGTAEGLTHAVQQTSEVRQPTAESLCHRERGKGIRAQQLPQTENWRQRVMLCCVLAGKGVTTDHYPSTCPLPPAAAAHLLGKTGRAASSPSAGSM